MAYLNFPWQFLSKLKIIGVLFVCFYSASVAAVNAELSSQNHGSMNVNMNMEGMHSQGGAEAHTGMDATDHGQAHSPKLDFKNFDRDQAYQYSQAVIGKTVANYRFTDSAGNSVELQDFAGKPVLISLIYTSCYHICPTTTQHLGNVAEMARQVMPNKDFTLLSIGFDTFNDTPQAMRDFAKKQGSTGKADWHFLSADAETIDALSRELGFIFYPSPQGFNHLVQTTILKSDQEIYRQVYGMKFDVQLLMEPLKELLFNRPSASFVGVLSDKIRFFCTVYDASGDRYRFDYSIFIGIFVGVMSCLALGLQLVKEWRRSIKLP